MIAVMGDACLSFREKEGGVFDCEVSGYGYRIQYSVFLCSLSRTMKAELENEIRQVIHFYEDQCCLIDLGELDDPADLFVVLGKPLMKIPKITFL